MAYHTLVVNVALIVNTFGVGPAYDLIVLTLDLGGSGQDR